MEMRRILERVHADAAPYVGHGHLADYIPSLAEVDAFQFGMTVVSCEGEETSIGDTDVRFSVQSVTKVFSLALVIAADDHGIWQRISREPSGNPFNSLLLLDQENGRPRNPFINAGALAVTDRLQTLTGDAAGAVRDLARAETGAADIDIDADVAASEIAHSHRNAAMAHLLASYGNLENAVDEVVEAYSRQCALAMSATEVARTGAFLARDGVRADGSRLLSRSQAKRINAVMLTCGTYDRAGEFAFRVGLPAKSGVGGAILAIIPGRGSICVWSPALGDAGNSSAGLAALDSFTTHSDWSVF
ncbi:glutaminase [Nocardioidaceae bacterium]|nr:glutaminase [Nocardioidaceae bacterium]